MILLKLRKSLRTRWDNLWYNLRAIKCLLKYKPDVIFTVLIFIIPGIFIGIVVAPIIGSIYISIGVGSFLWFIKDSHNFEKYEIYTVCFLECIESIDKFIIYNINCDEKCTWEKFYIIKENFITYYEELILYMQSLNLSPSIIKHIIDMKRIFDKIQDCDGCDYKILLYEVKDKVDRLKATCFSKYGFIYDKHLHS